MIHMVELYVSCYCMKVKTNQRPTEMQQLSTVMRVEPTGET